MTDDFREIFLAAVRKEIDSARDHFPGQEESLELSEWSNIIGEEMGEVCRGLNDGSSLGSLAAELVQVAAMAGRMFAAIQKRQRRLVVRRDRMGWSRISR